MRFDFEGSALVGVGRPENPGCRLFSAKIHEYPLETQVVPQSLMSVYCDQPLLLADGAWKGVGLESTFCVCFDMRGFAKAKGKREVGQCLCFVVWYLLATSMLGDE